ncbi:tubulin epsilon and delta complex protein 1 isoform X2 [Mustelus asterias]
MSVKEAITALCGLLLGRERAAAATLSPEIFRKAKFDRNEATAEFWKLLHWLLRLVNEDWPCEVTNLSEQVEYVKAAVCYYGYGFMDFYQLPADGTRGSRELLLVFSWLLQKIHLLEQLLNLHRMHVDDQASLCTIHLYTRGCSSSQSLDHLSATETRLIQDPKQYTEFVQHLERENMHLEAYLEWKRLEPLYWQWMQSVLSAKLQDTQELLNVNIVPVTGHSLDQRGNCRESDLFREIDKLCGELLKLQSELQDRRTVKDERIKDKEQAMGDLTGQCEAMFLTQHDLEQKLAAVRARMNHERRRHCRVRLALRANSTSVRTKPPPTQHNSGSLTALEVITQLKDEAVVLTKELQELQQLSKEALGEILERLDGVICIPPMQR